MKGEIDFQKLSLYDLGIGTIYYRDRMMSGWREKLFVKTHKAELGDLHQAVWVYVLVFLVWGVYRLFFRLPEWIEEVFLKMVVFGGPVLWVTLKKQKKSLASLGMSTKGLVSSVYLGVLLGLWWVVVGKITVFVASGGLVLNPQVGVKMFGELMFVSLFTAFWEELLFMGFLLPKFVQDTKSELLSLVSVGVMFALLHLPIQLATQVQAGQIVTRLILLLMLSVGNGVLYLRFKNLAAPVFSHLVWGSVIYLFG